MYTHVGLAHIKYYGIRCQNNTFSEIAPTMSLFFYTKTTCTGDEIRWDFINTVKTSKTSFTGFCLQMTQIYQTTNSGSEPFMSHKTFISWFFGWFSAFQIIKYYGIRCQNNTFSGIAPTMSLFFYTKTTCTGEEIRWDFINAVKTSETSFTGYCLQMTQIYQTNNSGSEPFMSHKTFISWFFGWLSAFQINFWKEIDPYCGHNPKILACDDTL